MRYCERNIKHGCYLEFFRGDWDGHHWNASSLYMDHDVYIKKMHLYFAFAFVVPLFDDCGVTLITAADWEEIKVAVLDVDRINAASEKYYQNYGLSFVYDAEKALEAIQEIDQWAQPWLKEEGCFTVLGI